MTTALFMVACMPPQQQTTGTSFSLGAPQTPMVAPTSLPAVAAVNPLTGSAANSAQSGLIGVLVNQLGINSQQAMGGAGSIFSLAQQHMNPADFMQLRGTMPGIDQYLSAVPQPTSTGLLLGSAANLLGGQSSELGRLAALAGSFQSLGMNANMISQFVPVVLQYIQAQSGPAMMGLLQSALY